MWKVLCLVGLVGLAGCQSFTPEQAAAFCAIAKDGTVLAVAVTKGGAQQTALKVAAVEAVIPCDPLAAAVGAILAAQK